MGLSATHTSMLANASRPAIQQYLARSRKRWACNRWLVKANVYRQDAVGRIATDTLKPGSQFVTAPNFRHLGEYVAASAITHCFDGWSFLSRAIGAELAGDPDAARHLAYYAELRAGMSILASDGIGVFKNRHVIVKKLNDIEFLNGSGTHEFVWDALDWWSSTARGRIVMQDVIVVGGIPIESWVSQFQGGATYFYQKWLEEWGLDLKQFKENRESRNLASYRPTAFTSPGPRPISHVLESIAAIWSMLEPGPGGGFPVLDRFLLREVLVYLYRSRNNLSDTLSEVEVGKSRGFRSQVASLVSNVSPGDLSAESWQKFLCHDVEPGCPRILRSARAELGGSDLEHSLSVLSRAMLLLRLATGSASLLLNAATSSPKDELRFWWSGVAAHRSLWEGADPPATMSDLWVDIDDAIEESQHWLLNSSDDSFFTFRGSMGRECLVLASTERAALWGLKL